MFDLSNENIIHIKKGAVEYIKFRRLLEYADKIEHCYTLIGNNNDYENEGNLEKNYIKLYETLNLDYKKMINIKHQAHSDIVDIVNSENNKFNNIDGLITNIKGVSLSLRFADCTPILLYDKEKNIIANIHSGWRGTCAKIAQKGVRKIIGQYNSNPENIIACIGPCIQKCHFKVDEDVKDIFYNNFSYMKDINKMIKKAEIEDGKQKYSIDTNIININLLKEVGIKDENIIDSKICTACNSNYMYSYRINKEKAGRNTAIIGLI